MNKALVYLKDGGVSECEYDDAENVYVMLENGRFVTFGKRTFPTDDIKWIEWIDLPR